MNILKFRFLTVTIFLLGFINLVQAQCAGNNAGIVVCEKDADDANRNFALFPILGGSPTAGGTWSTTNPENFYALNQSTGIVDLWRINNYGQHSFVYTNTDCNESATVTITLGGYPGEDNIDGSANACGDDPSVNLHGFLGSNVDGKVQDFNGLWQEDPSTFTGQLEDNIFNAQQAGPGIYNFTYTVPDVNSCSTRTSTVILEVHPPPNAGNAFGLTFCADDDLSAYTAFDLSDQLVGEDPNGTWTENGTNQLSDLNDSVINIQEMYDNFGYADFTFIYTVFPSHPVCEKRETEISISILPVLHGTISADDICSGEDYVVDLVYDDTLLHNGDFLIQYTIDGSLGDSPATLVDGNGDFIVSPGLVTLNKEVTLEIIGIRSVSPPRAVCDRVVVPPTTFLVTSSAVSAEDICVQNDNSIQIIEILDTDGNLANGNFTTEYTITDPDGGTTTSDAFELEFTNGAASFIIPGSNFIEGGDYGIRPTISDIYATSCPITDTFIVTPLPDAIQLDLIVDNNCDATQIDVLVDAPILPDGTYTITYDVTELGTNTVLTTNTINFTGGTAAYQIDVDALPIGNYTANVRSVQDDTTPCRLDFEFEENENFSRGGVPEAPVADAIQTFCLSDFTDTPTLIDIQVTAEGDVLFYETATDDDILPISTPLVDGEDYFVTNSDPLTNCEGTDRVQITVSFSNPDAPTTANSNPMFCAETNPTLSNISVNISNGSSITWFDAATGGSEIETSIVLVDGQTYFAATNSGGCTSTDRLEISPTVITVAPTAISSDMLLVCGLDTPTVVALRTLEDETENEVFWFITETGGTALTDDTPLIKDTVYYAENYNSLTGCSSATRVPVTIDFSNCDPENYDFFIPDGFSPNDDGRNDTFFIPNIETIFPDFTLEILNRYGTSLFKGDINNPAWDGRNGSATAPNGVYFYIINYNKDNSEPIQGRLYLNR
ncbi:gliding motility-associated C-terminal domain-containing protein [Maribacter sp. SA7]|uniref:gliding motility-associated C-terminal domain-containing protein n=1 Tax=Maribacter zhoushanensis TaxID=3030012 RepID=UPI0023ED8295|nr:gliding motility-associated C-terminal domain-containing protein [Maribacter zhoushanensis]MDF4202100.1 gliding motility-associated C-terminal domain-containing protein [Maribacter zhoushanensis]